MKFMELAKMSKGEAMRWISTAKVKDLKQVLKGEGVRVSKKRKSELVDEICKMIDNVDSPKVVIDIDEDIDKKITTARQMNELFSGLFQYPKKDEIKLIDDEIDSALKNLQYNADKIDKIIEHRNLIDEINNEILKDATVELRSEYSINNKGEIYENIYLVGGETYVDCSHHNIQRDSFLWISKGIIPNWFDLDAEADDEIKDDVLYYWYEDSYIAIENPYAEDIIDFNGSSDEIEERLMNKFGFKLEWVTNDICDVYVKNTSIVFSICVDTIIDAINGEANKDVYKISYDKLIAQKSKYQNGIRYIDVAYRGALDE